ncbi:AMP-binding protein [Aeromicrobium sp. REDSEA-S38_B2]|uniref:AMP-binding protein n=1 Tax=Aeromicrobium sp. REDSEA-S38_B2 TaxID=1811528 RepID=UPI00257F0A4A|nr:AMP-binding protein [Aeromicrobium sp. REDSEA-S38_B2]
MASLGFDLLDRHVIGGGADDPATSTLTFARLLERSSFLGSGLRMLGVQPGDEVGVQVAGDDRVVAVCACIRIGAVPAPDGAVVVADGDAGPHADVVEPLLARRPVG